MGELNQVYLSLGSNLGNRELQISDALAALELRGVSVLASSSYFYSKPQGFISPNDFCNVCVKVCTTLAPLALLQQLQDVERQLGREEKSNSNGYQDRPIDIDIIFFNTLGINDEKLTIPHPQWNMRPFVYLPLIKLVESLNI
jgi:2-amino-4-hydroxy-6-hydroxymethyldihydropteridine diphosphokinase